MAANPIVLGERELRPLVDTVALMDSAIDTNERTTLDFHRGTVREQNLVDQRESQPSNLLQIHFAANDEVITQLTALRGLGRWTADWFLARCCGRGDVCPAGDLAVRKAFDHHYGRRRPLSEEAIRRRSRAWGAYQNLAVHYLLAGMRLASTRAGGGTV